MAQKAAVEGDDLAALIGSWQRSLRARNRTAKTIRTYTEAAELFVEFLADTGLATRVG